MPVTINGTTGITVPNGTVSAPSIVGASSTAVGVYFPATGVAGIGGKFDVPGQAYADITGLTDGTTITPDFSTATNFSVTLGGNRTLANPTNLVAGQSGIIYVSQDATGSRTLAYGAYWKFPSGTAPTLTTTASATDALVYTVRSTTSITVQAVLNIG